MYLIKIQVNILFDRILHYMNQIIQQIIMIKNYNPHLKIIKTNKNSSYYFLFKFIENHRIYINK